MKPIFLVLGTVLFPVLLLVQCERHKPALEQGKITVVATIFPCFDFARQIAGDRVNLFMLLPPASESHSFEPTPQDIIKIQNCDVFIYNGGESDVWVEKILGSMDTGKQRLIAFMDIVDIVEEVLVEGMQEEPDTTANDAVPEYDEHVWTSPKNAKRIVKAISDVFCEVDRVNADIFQENTGVFLEKLDKLDMDFQDVVDHAVRKTIVFGDRFPFRYFADAYRLDYFAAFPGCSTETEPSAATIAFLINKIRAEQIPVIFHIELSNEHIADIISEETGARKLLFHACHNISKRDFEQGQTYLDFMSQNVRNLKEALQ
jgi:zinc transport system substrate-binding protein